ncbi:MAG: deoxyribose-phosphate aldolase [Flavobacteriaceae bacterium]|nr:deoxyribose-phosphate aldolase [Flavobacteriaceae bacterium]
MELNSYIDHTFLKPTATPEEIVKLCDEAKEYNFYAVCVSSCYVYLAANELKDSEVKVAATVGFPHGNSSKKSKVSEAKKCVKDGADEIDMVLNLGFLKSGLVKSVREEISAVKKAIGKRPLKVIIETCYLTDEEKRMACNIVVKAKANFVKTSTGFGFGGATLSDVILMKEAVGDKAKVKASGGIKDAKTAIEYIKNGVDRIGTSSGVDIMLNV